MGRFSYGTEITNADVALSVLSRCLVAVRKIREHGIANGPWQKREEWLNQQITLAWKDRGAFPGTGVALEAMGMRLGTALILDLRGNSIIKPETDPWPVVDEIFCNKRKCPNKAFNADIEETAPTWLALTPARKTLLSLLSRFDLTTAQAKRIWEESKRRFAFTIQTSDAEIIANPYVMAERDLGGADDVAVSLELIDRGVLPDQALASAPALPSPSCVNSPADKRRVRCGIVTVLRKAAQEGDSLLSLERNAWAPP